jgi:hypothetical protein
MRLLIMVSEFVATVRVYRKTDMIQQLRHRANHPSPQLVVTANAIGSHNRPVRASRASADRVISAGDRDALG